MLELTLRVTISLVVVFGLMAGMARLAKRPLRRRNCDLDVVARQQLTRSSSVAAIRAYDKLLIVGVTDSGISLLTEADPAAAGLTEPNPTEPNLGGPNLGGPNLGGPNLGEPNLGEPDADEADLVGARQVPVARRVPTGGRRVSTAGRRVSTAGRRTSGAQRQWQGAGRQLPGRRDLQGGGRLAGSALSLATWKQAIEYLRERTVRRS